MWKGWGELKSWVEINVLCIVDQDHQWWVIAVDHTSKSFSRYYTHPLWFITLEMDPHFINYQINHKFQKKDWILLSEIEKKESEHVSETIRVD